MNHIIKVFLILNLFSAAKMSFADDCHTTVSGPGDITNLHASTSHHQSTLRFDQIKTPPKTVSIPKPMYDRFLYSVKKAKLAAGDGYFNSSGQLGVTILPSEIKGKKCTKGVNRVSLRYTSSKPQNIDVCVGTYELKTRGRIRTVSFVCYDGPIDAVHVGNWSKVNVE